MAQGVSARALRVLNTPKPAFTKVYYANVGKMYDPVARPAGAVNLSVAENRVAKPMVLERMAAAGPCIDSNTLSYSPYVGTDRLRHAVARVLSRHVARCAVDAENVVLTNGAGSALWSLASMLADAGEGVMIPTPYYYSLDRDFGALTDCQIVPCARGDAALPDVEALSAAYDEAAARGVVCRVLAIVNPCNPTGRVATPEQVRAAVDWAASRNVDVIFNEVYAGTARPESGFRSVLELYQNGSGACKLPPNVHAVWGLSKDFAASGLRVANIYSGRPDITEACSRFNYFFMVGGPVQLQSAVMLEDDAWVDMFLEESRKRVIKTQDVTKDALGSVGAPCNEPGGSLFLWTDFRAWAAAAGGELPLFERLARAGVLVCPGAPFHAPEEGWFRLCPPAAPEGHLEVGLERMVDSVKSLGR